MDDRTRSNDRCARLRGTRITDRATEARENSEKR
jgi:hypothetical protein